MCACPTASFPAAGPRPRRPLPVGADGDRARDGRAARRVPRRCSSATAARRSRGPTPGRCPRPPGTAGVDRPACALHPGAGGAAPGAPADALRDLRVPLDALWGRAGAEAAERAERASGRRWRDALAPAPCRPRRPIRACSRRPAASSGRRRRPCRCSPARLGPGRAPAAPPVRRRGRVRPQAFARIARFRDRPGARAREATPLAAAAAEAGYADQAHMTREIAALAGSTPGALRAALTPRQSAGVMGGAAAQRPTSGIEGEGPIGSHVPRVAAAAREGWNRFHRAPRTGFVTS